MSSPTQRTLAYIDAGTRIKAHISASEVVDALSQSQEQNNEDRK